MNFAGIGEKLAIEDEPLERFRVVKLEILEGVKGTDGGPMKPFTLTFTTGGS